MALRFFSIFYDFLSTNAIFDFFSRTVEHVELKHSGNVSRRGLKQSCSRGCVTMDSWFLTNFSFRVLIGICVHSYWLLCNSMGSLMLIDIFDFFSETVSQIHLKFGGDVPLVGLYRVCSNGHAPMIFGFFINFLILKNFFYWIACLITFKVFRDIARGP